MDCIMIHVDPRRNLCSPLQCKAFTLCLRRGQPEKRVSGERNYDIKSTMADLHMAMLHKSFRKQKRKAWQRETLATKERRLQVKSCIWELFLPPRSGKAEKRKAGNADATELNTVSLEGFSQRGNAGPVVTASPGVAIFRSIGTM